MIVRRTNVKKAHIDWTKVYIACLWVFIISFIIADICTIIWLRR